MVSYLEGYARTIGAPVREGVAVSRLRGGAGDFALETSEGPVASGSVIVATGAFQKPTASPLGASLPVQILQLHTSEYRNPGQLPEGAVLVVGSGQSGCQIAEELLQAGRRVYLSVGRCPWFPRRLYGRDITHWAIALGLADDRVENLPSPAARLACNPTVSGNDGGHDCNPRTLAAAGPSCWGVSSAVSTAWRTQLQASRRAWPPATRSSSSSGRARRSTSGRTGSTCPRKRPEPAAGVPDPPRVLDLDATGVGTVLWANGFRPDCPGSTCRWPTSRAGPGSATV